MFYRLTRYEYERMCEGWKKEYDQRRQQEATWVANLMNASGNMKEPVTADSLINGKQAAAVMDNEAIRKRAEERRRERIQERNRKGER